MEISDKKARELWRTYESLGQQLREAFGVPLGAQPGDEDAWDALELPARVYNAIHYGCVALHNPRFPIPPFTVGELAAVSDADFTRLKNFGRHSLRDLREAIRVHRIVASRREHAQDNGR